MSLRSRGLPANIMAFSVRGTVASVSCSSGVPLLQGSTRLRVASASSAVMPATRRPQKALRAQSGIPSITAFARSVRRGISQLARWGTTLPSSLATARLRIVLAPHSQQRDHVPP